MYAQQRRSPGALSVSRRQRRGPQHAHLLVRCAPASVIDTPQRPPDPLVPRTPAPRHAERPRHQRRTVPLRTAAIRVQTLQHRVAQLERERDQALADTGELRLRLSRLATRLYTLEAERRARPAALQPNELEAIVQQLKRLQGAEQHNQALEQELVRLRATVGALTYLAAPQAAAVPASPRPWYRRFWFALIGKDVRAAEWSASQHAH